MRIIVIGADGQLGTDLIKLNPKAIGLTIKDLDITDASQCAEILTSKKPDIIINTAAYHNVDDCEDNPEPAFRVNAIGPRNLAIICKNINSVLLHISTDYIFSGEKSVPYHENDIPSPTSIYGISKLAGELTVKYLLPKSYIIRTSGLYGAAGCLGKGGTNFIEGMIKRAKSGQTIKVVNDEIVVPTYTRDLARKIFEIIEKNSYGLYHVSNSGQCSWHEFTMKIFELMKIDVPVIAVSGAEFKAKAKRPKYSVLANDNLKNIGLEELRPWPEALSAYLKEKGYIK